MEPIEQIPVALVHRVFELPTVIFKRDDLFSEYYENGGEVAVANYSCYFEICQRLQPHSIFEIGVRAGYSAYAMLSGSPLGTLYRGLDLNEGTHGGVVGYTDYARDMLPQWFPESDIKIVIGDSQQFSGLSREFDLSHVDGDHDTGPALHDVLLCAWYSDYVLIDDITFLPSVRTAVNEFLLRYQDEYALETTFYDTWRGHVLIKTAKMREARHTVLPV